MKKFKPKARELDAKQFTGLNLEEILDIIRAAGDGVTWRVSYNTEAPFFIEFQKPSVEGSPSMSGAIGVDDWIILENGILSSAKNVIFTTYFEEG